MVEHRSVPLSVKKYTKQGAAYTLDRSKIEQHRKSIKAALSRLDTCVGYGVSNVTAVQSLPKLVTTLGQPFAIHRMAADVCSKIYNDVVPDIDLQSADARALATAVLFFVLSVRIEPSCKKATPVSLGRTCYRCAIGCLQLDMVFDCIETISKYTSDLQPIPVIVDGKEYGVDETFVKTFGLRSSVQITRLKAVIKRKDGTDYTVRGATLPLDT